MVITGTDEARLIHQAAVYGVDVGSGRAVVIDIGGGSVEITLGAATAIQLARSFKLGAIRLTERFVKSDPLERRDERKMVRHIDATIGKHLAQIADRAECLVLGSLMKDAVARTGETTCCFNARLIQVTMRVCQTDLFCEV